MTGTVTLEPCPAPLVVVSNRLPFNISRKTGGCAAKRNVGGLVNALEPVLAERGGAWVGWDGAPLPSGASIRAAMAHEVACTTNAGVELRGVPLSEREISLYYHGFSNRALWPLLHDFPEKAVFLPEDYSSYTRVNQRFAEIALARAGAGSRIWVHDFHLMLVPRFLRRLGFQGRIDFFLHTPFPPPEIFRALPWREELLRGLLASDGVGFHVDSYLDNFVGAARQLAGARQVTEDPTGHTLLNLEGREVSARAVPIGIDVKDFESIAGRVGIVAWARRIRQSHPSCRILFCADRLDYTKGIKERLQVLETFLRQHPEAVGSTVLIQVVVPSRHLVEEYRSMKREIDREVGRINGEFGGEGWMPIHYRYRALDRDELVAHYRAADVALVTPLRDGMNLVASEFVASRSDEDGVLIVSEFAGAAERCPGAIRVNPYDVEGCSRAIATALTMGAAERRNRMVALRRSVRSNPASRWARGCLEHERPGSTGWPLWREHPRVAVGGGRFASIEP